MKILIADDDAILRSELAGLLREDGHDVVGASDGGGRCVSWSGNRSTRLSST